MLHNRRIRPRPKITYSSKDRKKLMVMLYLESIGTQGATKNNIVRKAKIRTQESHSFTILMDELVYIEWVQKSRPETVDGYEFYTITDKGREVLHEARDLVQRNSPLGSLDVFKGVFEP